MCYACSNNFTYVFSDLGVYRDIGLSTSNTKTVPARSLMTVSSTPLQTLTRENEPWSTSTQYMDRKNGTNYKQTGIALYSPSRKRRMLNAGYSIGYFEIQSLYFLLKVL